MIDDDDDLFILINVLIVSQTKARTVHEETLILFLDYFCCFLALLFDAFILLDLGLDGLCFT